MICRRNYRELAAPTENNLERNSAGFEILMTGHFVVCESRDE